MDLVCLPAAEVWRNWIFAGWVFVQRDEIGTMTYEVFGGCEVFYYVYLETEWIPQSHEHVLIRIFRLSRIYARLATSGTSLIRK